MKRTIFLILLFIAAQAWAQGAMFNNSFWNKKGTASSTGGGAPPPGSGFFVLSSGHNGNFRGAYSTALLGADAFCQNELQTKSWKNKPQILTASKIKGFLCTNSACNNLAPNKTYYFAIVDQPHGGAFFDTDANGRGPGNRDAWSDTNHFGGQYMYFTGRGRFDETLNTDLLWKHLPSAYSYMPDTCNNWTNSTTDKTIYKAEYGNSGSSTTGSGRYVSGGTVFASCGDTTMRLICFVDP